MQCKIILSKINFFVNKFTINKYGSSDSINTSGKYVTNSEGNAITNNYIVKGKFNITSINKYFKSSKNEKFNK